MMSCGIKKQVVVMTLLYDHTYVTLSNFQVEKGSLQTSFVKSLTTET